MKTRKTRKIFRIFFTVTFVFGAVMLICSFVACNTLCRSAYMSRFLTSTRVVSQLDESFENRIGALSKECGIPTTVFITARDDIKESDKVVVRFYKGYGTSLYGSEKVETVKNYCKEYLTAAGVKYTNAQLASVAERAIRIYDESYGLANSEEAYDYVQLLLGIQNKLYSAALLFLAGSAVAILLLYSKKEEQHKVLMSQFNATAFTLVLLPLTCLVFGIGTHVRATPYVYASAIANAVRADYVLVLIIGLAMTAFSVYYTPKIYSKSAKH